MISVVKGNIDGLAVDATVPTGLLPFGEAVCIGFTEPKANGAVNAAAPGREFFADTDKLRLATREVLLRAGERGQCHIAFPAAGQEAHAYDAAAKAIISETRRHLAYAGSIEKIIFSVFDDRAFDAFLRIAGRDQVACLGDSITFGYPYGPQASWVALAASMSGLELVNMGINGDSTLDMLYRFNYDVIPEAPAYVIIMGGANDVLNGADVESIQDNIKAMTLKAFKAGICPVLGMPPPALPGGGFVPADLAGRLAEAMEDIGGWIKVFAEQEGLPVLDFYTPMLDPQTGKGNRYYYTDGAHPNQNGYRELARAAQGLLNRLKKGINIKK